MAATPNKDQSLEDAPPCKLMLDWCPRTVPSVSYKAKGKVWPIIGILHYIPTTGKAQRCDGTVCTPILFPKVSFSSSFSINFLFLIVAHIHQCTRMSKLHTCIC